MSTPRRRCTKHVDFDLGLLPEVRQKISTLDPHALHPDDIRNALRALASFVADVEDSGGITYSPERVPCPVADQSWSSIGYSYENAVAALWALKLHLKRPVVDRYAYDEDEHRRGSW